MSYALAAPVISDNFVDTVQLRAFTARESHRNVIYYWKWIEAFLCILSLTDKTDEKYEIYTPNHSPAEPGFFYFLNKKHAFFSSTDKCLLTDNIYDYYNVSQGKVTIPSMDDGEEFSLTDVSRVYMPNMAYTWVVFTCPGSCSPIAIHYLYMYVWTHTRSLLHT